MIRLKRLIYLGSIVAAMVLPCQYVAAEGADLSKYQMVEMQGNHFYYQPPVADKALKELGNQTYTARRRIQQLSGDSMMYPVKVVLAPDDTAYAKLAGSSAENSLAVALTGQQTVVVNRLYQNRWPDVSFQSLLVHEWMHVYLDVKYPGKVPRWLHEGVAQMAAGDTADRSSLAWARLTDSLIPLSEMHRSMPSHRERSQFAYRQSLAVTEHLIRERHSGSLPAFLAYLKTPQGAQFLDLLDDAGYENSILKGWKQEQTVWMSFIVIMSSGTTIWLASIVLLFVAYFVLRRRRRQRYMEEDSEPEEYLEGFDDPAAEFDRMAEETADDWKR